MALVAPTREKRLSWVVWGVMMQTAMERRPYLYAAVARTIFPHCSYIANRIEARVLFWYTHGGSS